MAKVASYDSATFKDPELLRTTHSTANVCLWKLHGYMLDFIHLLAMAVAETPELDHLEGCPHTFGYIQQFALDSESITMEFRSDGN